MSHDPFLIDGPTCLSVSGGRTSGYMLARVLQANGGKLPPETAACFANTGKEDEATLLFVRDMQQRWQVPIVWLEWREGGYAVVDYTTASRNGEPFEALIRHRGYLPNPITRFCTSELKIRTMHRYLRDALGWRERHPDGWDQMVGIRADEQRRVAKIRARGRSTESALESMRMPLAEAGVTVREVTGFWREQPFDLRLTTVNGRTLEGNCDLCFLKPWEQRLSLVRQKPQCAVWWARMEASGIGEGRGAFFTKDTPPYAQMAAFAAAQGDMFEVEEGAGMACFCGD